MATALALSTAASATIIPLSVSMDGSKANAGAGTGSLATGSATLTLDTDTNALTWDITWADLGSAATAMHFHGPALPNQSTGVVVDVGVAGPPVVGNATITEAQESDLLAGLWYLNLHTTGFPGGEIRGQVEVVPEPTTLALLAGGLGLLAVTRKSARA